MKIRGPIPIIGQPCHDLLSVAALAQIVADDEELLSFYEQVGRGEFCDFFTIGYPGYLEPLDTDSLDAEGQEVSFPEDGSLVPALIASTSNGVSIGYSNTDGYVVVDDNAMQTIPAKVSAMRWS